MTLHATINVNLGTFVLDVELEVEAGKTVAVVGANGAGKTTLLKALAGLRPISAGKIVIDNMVLDDPSTRTFVPPRQRSIGVVFQDNLLFPHMDAIDNVAFGLRAQGVNKSAANELALTWLKKVGISERARAKPAELSGGQAQRVALARAIVLSPRMLLLDEPLGALDAAVRDTTRDELNQQLTTFEGVRLLVTHDFDDALRLAHHVIVLEDGQAVQQGTPDHVAGNPASSWIARFVKASSTVKV